MSVPFWSDAEVVAALGELLLAPPTAEEGSYTVVSTDTRALGPGSLFVALRGERFDAHEFLSGAAAAGARGAVVERVPEGAPAAMRYYVVRDTLEALGALARHYRRSLKARVCAVVGSNGKTTTKELARAALSARYRVHATTGNLNNLVGVPLTLLAAPADAEALVVEAGTNAPGEVARLAAIVEPDAVIVTSIGEEHLEGLGDLDGVLAEETAILPALPPDGVALVADEPDMLVERARELAPRVRVAGWGALADDALRPERVELDEEGRVVLGWRGGEVTLPLRGRVNARNALLALGLAEAWGIAPADALAALGAATVPAMRSEIYRYGELLVIADCYNANPASVEAAVELLLAMPRRAGRVAVLGTMRELGPASESLHRRLADAVATAGLDLVVATGEFAEAFAPHAETLGARLIQAEDPLEAYGALARKLGGGEVILLKGSRGVALERLLPHFEKDFSDPAVVAGQMRRAGDGAARATGE